MGVNDGAKNTPNNDQLSAVVQYDFRLCAHLSPLWLPRKNVMLLGTVPKRILESGSVQAS